MMILTIITRTPYVVIIVIIIIVPDPFDVRLVGGKTPWEGRVEVRVNDVWGSGCVDWNEDILQVVCKQLGYSSALIGMIVTFLKHMIH